MRSLEQLFTALRSPNPQKQDAAFSEVYNFVLKADSDIKVLIEALTDRENIIQAAACRILINAGEKAINPLIQLFLDKGQTVREEDVHRILISIGEKEPSPLLDLISHSNASVRILMVNVLGRLQPVTQEIVLALIKALSDENGVVKLKANQALKKQGELAVKLLIETLSNPDPEMRANAADTLADIGPVAGSSALARLIQLLEDDNLMVRDNALKALGKIGASGPANPTTLQLRSLLLEKLSSPVPEVRASSATALGDLGVSDDQGVEQLIQCLLDSAPSVRSETATALGKLGSDATTAISALTKCLSDEKELVRRSAALAIFKIDSTNQLATERLSQILSEKEPRRLLGVIMELGELGSKAKLLVEPLLTCLTDSNDMIKWSTIEALGKIGDVRALPALELIRQKDLQPGNAFSAEIAINQIKQDNKL